MALWFPIMVNDSSVGVVALQRIAPVDRAPVEGEECTYILEYVDRPPLNTVKYVGNIKHPYKTANPIPLLSAALKQIEEQCPLT